MLQITIVKPIGFSGLQEILRVAQTYNINQSIIYLRICHIIMFLYNRFVSLQYENHISITCHKYIPMDKFYVTSFYFDGRARKGITLFVIQDGLFRHSCTNQALAFQTRAGFRHLCREKPISHSKQCHIHIVPPSREHLDQRIQQEASRPNSYAFYLGICRTPIQNWKICLNSHEKLTKSGII